MLFFFHTPLLRTMILGSMLLFPLPHRPLHTTSTITSTTTSTTSTITTSRRTIIVAMDPRKSFPHEFQQHQQQPDDNNIFFNVANILSEKEKKKLSLHHVKIHEFPILMKQSDELNVMIEKDQFIRWTRYISDFDSDLTFTEFRYLEKDVAHTMVELARTSIKKDTFQTIFLPYSWLSPALQSLSPPERDTTLVLSPVLEDRPPSIGDIGYIPDDDLQVGNL